MVVEAHGCVTLERLPFSARGYKRKAASLRVASERVTYPAFPHPCTGFLCSGNQNCLNNVALEKYDTDIVQAPTVTTDSRLPSSTLNRRRPEQRLTRVTALQFPATYALGEDSPQLLLPSSEWPLRRT